MFRSTRNNLLLGGLALAVAAGILPASGQGPLKEGQRITVPEGSPLRTELTIAVAAGGEVERTLEFPAVVEADPSHTARVLPPVAGRVIDVKVQLGDRVAQQQELAVIYLPGIRRTRLDETEARSMSTSANEPLEGDQIGFQRAGDEVAEPSAAQLRALGVPVDGPQSDGLLSLRAPVGGTVINLLTRLGEQLSPAVSMMTIANLDTVRIMMSVPKDITALVVGHPAQLRFPAYPDKYFTSEPRLADGAFEKEAPTTKLKFAMQNPNAWLKLNMSATARFSGLKQTAAIIPVAALVSNQKMAFVEVGPWTFEARAVTLDRLEGGRAIVANGVKVGDRIVSTGAALLLARQPE
jgi:cobalt-zinc-cadmium efflux system membrane fusion protein